MVRVLESSVIGRAGPDTCEDLVVIDDRPEGVAFVAVIDGATDKTGKRWNGKTGGLLAAETIAARIRLFPEDIDPHVAVGALTAACAELRHRLGIALDSVVPPTASVAILSVARRELWRVGDIHLGIRGDRDLRVHPGEKAVDVAAALARAAFTSAALAAGISPDEVTRDDPGRAFILPLLEAQGSLANDPTGSPFSYGVIDGTPVPDEFVEVLALGDQTCEVVMASDGYVTASASLEESERLLAASLESDPMRIGEHRSTKGVRPGASSFDDRSYVRLRLD